MMVVTPEMDAALDARINARLAEISAGINDPQRRTLSRDGHEKLLREALAEAMTEHEKAEADDAEITISYCQGRESALLFALSLLKDQ
jgi:hypothetical protein